MNKNGKTSCLLNAIVLQPKVFQQTKIQKNQFFHGFYYKGQLQVHIQQQNQNEQHTLIRKRGIIVYLYMNTLVIQA